MHFEAELPKVPGDWETKEEMKGLPFFKWYAADAETDESYSMMTDEQIGFYHRCLNKSWINGSLPASPVELALLMRVNGTYLKKVWRVVGPKFQPSESDPSRLVNKRQEDERNVAMVKSRKAAKSANVRYVNDASRVRTHPARTENAPIRASDSDSDSDSKNKLLQRSANEVQENWGDERGEPAYWSERLYTRHPKKRLKPLVEDWVCKFFAGCASPVAFAERMEAIDRVHALWCESEQWKQDGGQFVPKLAEWLADDGWKTEPTKGKAKEKSKLDGLMDW